MTLFWDTETHPISRGNLAPTPVCAQWGRSSDPATVSLAHVRDSVEEIASWLESEETIAGVNTPYDWAVIASRYPCLVPLIWRKYDRGQIEDIDLRELLLDIARGRVQESYSLLNMASRHGITVAKDDTWRLNYASLAEVPISYWPEDAVAYCRQDVTAPAQLWEIQEGLARGWETRMGAPVLHDSPAQSRAAWALHLMACTGVYTDPGRVAVERQRVEAYLATAGVELVAAGLVQGPVRVSKRGIVSPNPKSGSRMQTPAKALMSEAYLGEPPITATGLALMKSEGRPLTPEERLKYCSLDADACDQSGLEILRMYAAYGSADTLLARIGDLEAGTTEPLQARFRPLLETGRTSCTKPMLPLRGTQLQNPPRAEGIRECFRPPAGWLFFDADLSMAELHTLAQSCLDLFGYSRLAEQLNRGIDVHLWFGATVCLGIPYEEAIARYRAGDPLVEGARQRAKPANFGFPGGMGPKKFVIYSRQYGVTFTEEEARALKAQWIAAFPEMADYFRHVDGLMRGDTGTFRHLQSGRWRGGAHYPAICNSLFQGRAADGAKAGLYVVSRACYAEPASPLYGCRPWSFVHDQIIGQGPADQCPEAAEELARLFVNAFNEWVPDVPSHAEPCVMDVWSKRNKTLRDPSGRLRPWLLRDHPKKVTAHEP